MRLIALLLTFTLPAFALAEDWPQWLGTHRDAKWNETGLIEKFPKDGPKVLWEAKVGLGYAGPAVAAGFNKALTFGGKASVTIP